MESATPEASFRANLSSSVLAELPPKKRASESGKAVTFEPSETHNLLRSDMNTSEKTFIPLNIVEATPQNGPREKASLDQVPFKADATPEILSEKGEPEPSFNLLSHLNKGESSSSHPPGFPLPSSASQSRMPAVCKFCGQQFSTTQALGGHQNAHKHEREMQRALKAAHEFATNPFILNLPNTRAPLFQGSHYGPHLRYSPYHGYAHRGWQPRSNFSYPRMSLVQGPTNFSRDLEGFIRPSLVKPPSLAYSPGWPRPYVQASGPIRSYMQATNFDPIAPSNMTHPLQVRDPSALSNMTHPLQVRDPIALSNMTHPLHVRENEHGIGKKQCTESTGLSLSLKSSEHSEHDLPPFQCKNGK